MTLPIHLPRSLLFSFALLAGCKDFPFEYQTSLALYDHQGKLVVPTLRHHWLGNSPSRVDAAPTSNFAFCIEQHAPGGFDQALVSELIINRDYALTFLASNDDGGLSPIDLTIASGARHGLPADSTAAARIEPRHVPNEQRFDVEVLDVTFTAVVRTTPEEGPCPNAPASL